VQETDKLFNRCCGRKVRVDHAENDEKGLTKGPKFFNKAGEGSEKKGVQEKSKKAQARTGSDKSSKKLVEEAKRKNGQNQFDVDAKKTERGSKRRRDQKKNELG